MRDRSTESEEKNAVNYQLVMSRHLGTDMFITVVKMLETLEFFTLEEVSEIMEVYKRAWHRKTTT